MLHRGSSSARTRLWSGPSILAKVTRITLDYFLVDLLDPEILLQPDPTPAGRALQPVDPRIALVANKTELVASHYHLRYGGGLVMSERIIELLHRNLQEVFGEGDAARRRAAIDQFYTDDCVLYVPPGVFVGRDALDKFAGDLRATHPDFLYTPHGEAQALHNCGILAWGSGPAGEAPDYTGLDVIIVRDGRIAALYVFLNPKLS
jgi:SnoaL-like domain